MLLLSLLQPAGFEVKEASDGEDAISKFISWQPHFIWMDMRMPVLDGYQATRRIRQLPGGEAVKIVAITASVFQEQHAQILAAGCDHIVHKPYRRQEIFETMGRLLGLRYLFKEMSASVTVAPLLAADMPKAIERLPHPLRDKLIEAAQLGDQEGFLVALGNLPNDLVAAAAFLNRLAEDYRFDVILELLQKKAAS